MHSKFRKTSLIAITSIISNILFTIYALIYNKIVIVHYGSSVSGLISTLTQFVTLFTVLEGGFSTAVVVASYKPILNKDYTELNSILFTAKKYLYKIAFIYVSIVSACGLIYLLFLDSPLGFFYSTMLLLVTTLSTSLSIGGATKYTVVLSGSNRQYITILIAIICRTITWTVSIFLIIHDVNVVLIYSMNVVNSLLNILLLMIYEKKYYPDITFKGNFDLKKIPGIKDMIFQKIASTLFTSTDLILVSVGLNLSQASVYYIYNQIFQGVYQYLSSMGNAPMDSFGQLIKSGEKEKAKELFLIYKKTINILSAVFFTGAATMIIPFMRVYTKNVQDENYISSSLAILFFSYYYCKQNNLPYGLIINASGEFKKQNTQTVVASIANIVCSILFMLYIGLNGIVLGSVIGTIIILFVNIYKSKDILSYNIIKDIIFVILNYLVGLLIVFLYNLFFDFRVDNYMIWGLAALLCMIIISCIIIPLNYLMDKDILVKCVHYYFSKIKKHQARK